MRGLRARARSGIRAGGIPGSGGRRRSLWGVAAFALAFTLGVPTPAASQEDPDGVAPDDSVVVIERGVPGVEVWDFLEFPFRVLSAPLYVAGSGVTALIGVAERGHWVPWVAYYNRQLTDRGIYLAVGGQGPNSGSGAELLLGVPPRAGSVWANVLGGATVKGYWRAEAQAGFGIAEAAAVDAPAASVRGFASIEHRAEDELFGVGRRSLEVNRSDFELDRRWAGGRLEVVPVKGLELELSAGWERSEAGPGGDDRVPSVDRIFPSRSLPGFEGRRDYVSVGAAAAWRVGYPHAIERGGRWASVGYGWNQSESDGAADFGSLTASAGIDLPFDHDLRSVALSIRYQALRPSGDGDIAFYHLPTLGASDLPSYRAQRFRDRDLILGQSEYRFRVWDDPRGRAAVDASFFLYAGMVARSLSSEFRFDRLQESYGMALSLVDESSRIARLRLALGGERTQLMLDFRVAS